MAYSVTGFAVVTGAAGGIGKELAFAFAEAGAKGVLCADIKGDSATQVAEEIKTLAVHPDFKAFGVSVDITSAESIQSLVKYATSKFGRIDYAANAVGVDVHAAVPFSLTSEEDFSQVLNVNARGAFLLTKTFASTMAEQQPCTISTKRFGTRDLGRGSIVHVASAMAFGAVPCKTPYITSKHALLGMTRASALDLSRSQIRVNLVSPTWVETTMLDESRKRVPNLDKLIQGAVPNGRPIDPDEVAAAVLYLCGASSTFITGSNIMIDGGLSIGPTFGM